MGFAGSVKSSSSSSTQCNPIEIGSGEGDLEPPFILPTTVVVNDSTEVQNLGNDNEMDSTTSWPTVVSDSDTGYTMMGFASVVEPSFIVPTGVALNDSREIQNFKNQNEIEMTASMTQNVENINEMKTTSVDIQEVLEEVLPATSTLEVIVNNSHPNETAAEEPGSDEEKNRAGGAQTSSLLEEMKLLKEMHDHSGTRKAINSELWHACAGQLVSLPELGSLVCYFPQGHCEQVAASTKRIATSNLPSYPNLPSQLLCQVHNVTLHVDKDTEEIFAQMSLLPVNSEKDIIPVPDFGLKPMKHPTEFFSKTLTASDTSAHGGLSVPRRAAEKLFPQLDFTMQPPTQDLVVRDLHDNTWTFRHIYRGNPKRYLLTTGWSAFVSAKRLKAGDSVLFIRDEKSQLLVGVRRANRQQTTLPSSVLSADCMHIGVLEAASHAVANRTSFAIFYNPRACPSEFVIPLEKYHRAVYGTRISVGMRFGMMFEIEESGKRSYMGTIVGVSDLDPLRWPGSQWRNLQVEWDEPGCGDKQTRVNSWEIEPPESLFMFPSLMYGLKQPYHPGLLGMSNMIRRPYIQAPASGNADFSVSMNLDMLFKYQQLNQSIDIPSSSLQDSGPRGDPLQEMHILHTMMSHKPQPMRSVPQTSDLHQIFSNGPNTVNSNTFAGGILQENPELQKIPDYQAPDSCFNSNVEDEVLIDQLSQLLSVGNPIDQNLIASPGNPQNFANQPQMQSDSCPMQPQLESSTFQSQQIVQPQFDSTGPNGLVPNDANEWTSYPSNFQSVAGVSSPGPCSVFKQDKSVAFPEAVSQPFSSVGQEMWDNDCYNLENLFQIDQLPPLPQLDWSSLNCISNSSSFKGLTDESNNQGGIYSCVNNSNGGSSLVDPSVWNTILDDFCILNEVAVQNPLDCLVGNFCSSQDIQSQMTSVNLTESRAFSRPDYADYSGGTSLSNVDFDESALLQNSSWQKLAPPKRTYTKVRKAGSIGRSIDVTSFNNYEELVSAIERLFGLEGLLNDPIGSGWKLVYLDYENDVLLVGDDPWEEFVHCVGCIRILSPSDVRQMSEQEMVLLNSDTNGSIQTVELA